MSVQQIAFLSEIYNIEDRGAIFWCEESFENLQVDYLTGESRILLLLFTRQNTFEMILE